MYTDTALTRELVSLEVKLRQVNAFPKCIWDWACQKKCLEKNEAKMCTDHALTSELVIVKPKFRQLNTIPE